MSLREYALMVYATSPLWDDDAHARNAQKSHLRDLLHTYSIT
jgi:hypothetical protein